MKKLTLLLSSCLIILAFAGAAPQALAQAPNPRPYYAPLLYIEKGQVAREQKVFPKLTERLAAIDALAESDPRREAEAIRLLDETAKAPVKAGTGLAEPSDLEGIRKARPDGPRRLPVKLTAEALHDRLLGAWLGRCAGNLLGKPIETWRRDRIVGLAKASGNYPIRAYFSSAQPDAVRKKFEVDDKVVGGKAYAPWANNLTDGMPEDDDLNYTVANLAVLESCGRDFTPQNLADFWLGNLPYGRVFADEQIAYRNLATGVMPPLSGGFRNPCREWIGAQIRADLFGYVNPGGMEQAAAMAWRDGCMSHVKNGIYGEMWVAAMLAAAATTSDTQKIVTLGLTEIPAHSRLARSVNKVISWHRKGIRWEEAEKRIRKEWDETRQEEWCHVVPNAMIVAAALLWGQGDFGKSIGLAVAPGFDTDCNGATVGSVAGLALGARAIPPAWTAPLKDTYHSSVDGRNLVKLSAMARQITVCAQKSLAAR